MRNRNGFMLIESVLLFVLSIVISLLVCVVVLTYHRFTTSSYNFDLEGELSEIYK